MVPAERRAKRRPAGPPGGAGVLCQGTNVGPAAPAGLEPVGTLRPGRVRAPDPWAQMRAVRLPFWRGGHPLKRILTYIYYYCQYTMPEAIIKVQNLKKQYENDGVITEVLFGLDFEIKKCEFVAFMGPSGCGKSTLMHILGFLDKLTEGKYFFEDTDVSKLDDDQLAEMRSHKVGFIFQAFNLLPRTTVLENVMMPLIYTHIPQSERVKLATKAVEAVGLAHRINNLSNQLSGG